MFKKFNVLSIFLIFVYLLSYANTKKKCFILPKEDQDLCENIDCEKCQNKFNCATQCFGWVDLGEEEPEENNCEYKCSACQKECYEMCHEQN